MTWGGTAVGATHVCLPSFDARAALDLAERYPVTHLCGAPIVLSELARAGVQRGFRARGQLRAAVGGAPPTKETIAAVHLAYDAGWGAMVSHRSGETVDPFIADLTVALDTGISRPARRVVASDWKSIIN